MVLVQDLMKQRIEMMVTTQSNYENFFFFFFVFFVDVSKKRLLCSLI